MTWHLILTLLIVLLNAFFVAAEFAIVKVRNSQLEIKKSQWSTNASVALHITSNLDKYLSAVQLGVTLTSLGLGWVWEESIGKIILSIIQSINLPISPEIVDYIALPISFFIITLFHIVFGELTPKGIAINNPLGVAMFISKPMRLFYYIFRPLIWIFNVSSNLILRLIGIQDIANHKEVHTEEEIKLLLTESEEQWQIAETSNELIQNVFEFDDRTVKHIYTPRSKVFMVDIDEPIEDIIQMVNNEGYSRIPVYRWDKDNIIWVLYAKDFTQKLISGEKDIDIKKLLRDAYIVPLSQKIEILLKDFQRKRTHIAIVHNEHGETVGIVTLEDIIEELIWDIQDESDEEAPMILERKPGTYLARWEITIFDLEDVIWDIIPESETYNTLSGFLIDQYGSIPSPNIIINYNKHEFTIVKVVNSRIELVKIRMI